MDEHKMDEHKMDEHKMDEPPPEPLNHTASSITITIANHVITCTPLNCYMVGEKFIVIMYQLRHESPDKPTAETTIPYYISTGETNRLKADMLYPFMCFNSRGKDPLLCPQVPASKLPNFGLLKYSITTNMNLNSIVTSTEEEYKSKEVGNPHLKGGIYTLGRMSQNNTYGITTIFMRIKNVLDFIICISSKKLRMYDPSYTEEQLMDFVPDEPSKLYKDADVLKYEQMYRRCVLNKLHDMIHTLQDAQIATYTDVTLPIVPKTHDEFNAIINVCPRKAEHESKLLTYKRISHDLYQLIHKHKNDSFPYLLPEDQVTLVPDHTELDMTIRIWKATCESDLEYVLHQISRIPESHVFESIKLYGSDLFTDYKNSPEQTARINHAFLPKIVTDLSSQSPIDSIQLIDQHRDYISTELYQTLIDLYLPTLIKDVASQPNPAEIMESIRTHLSDELYSKITESIEKKGMRKKSNKSKRHGRKSKKRGRKRLKVV